MIQIKNKYIILLAFLLLAFLFLFVGFITSSNITGSSFSVFIDKFSFFIGKATYSCTDSDNGLNYDTYGYVTYKGYKYSDICLSNNILREWYCKSNRLNYKKYTCPNGCLDGKCTITPSCIQPTNLQPSGTITTSSQTINVTLSWNAVSGAVSYDVRLDDGTSDRYKDTRYNNCGENLHYYCVNNIKTNSITNVPVKAGRSYTFWLHPRYSPPRNDCSGSTSFKVIITVTPYVYVCESIKALSNTQNDASAAIQKCIDDAPANSIVELPPGKFTLDKQISIINKPITLRTQGKTQDMLKCAVENHDCAELIASPSFSQFEGMIAIHTAFNPGTVIDHIVVNGNKLARANSPAATKCRNYDNTQGHNIVMYCTDCSITNIVSKNALCGTSLGAEGNNMLIANNTLAFNGIHDQKGLWADGLTILNPPSNNMKILNNEIVDSTDVDLVLLTGCTNCLVQNNKITHAGSFSGGSFAALVVDAYGGASGDYTNTVISNNYIDCGSTKACGIGLLLGEDPWQEIINLPFGASVYGNTIKNAQNGFMIDDVHDFKVYNNKVIDSGGFFLTGCGGKVGRPYSMGDRSYNIDVSKDTLDTKYTMVEMKGCTFNWWDVEFSNLPTTLNSFVTHMYQCVQERNPEQAGFDNWKNALITKAVTIEGFYKASFDSVEYKAKKTSNEKFMTQIYNCILFRNPDKAGFDSWVNGLNNNIVSRTQVLDASLSSNEYKTNIKPKIDALK